MLFTAFCSLFPLNYPLFLKPSSNKSGSTVLSYFCAHSCLHLVSASALWLPLPHCNLGLWMPHGKDRIPVDPMSWAFCLKSGNLWMLSRCLTSKRGHCFSTASLGSTPTWYVKHRCDQGLYFQAPSASCESLPKVLPKENWTKVNGHQSPSTLFNASCSPFF